MSRLFALVLVLLLPGLAHSAVEKGAVFPAYTVKDAFGVTNTLSKDTRFVIIVSEKDVSGKVNDWLKTKPADFLSSKSVEYVSDITPMPAVITTLFALPKMKKYPFKILLADDPSFAKTYPSQPGKIAVFVLDASQQVTGIHYVDTAGEVEKLISP